MNHGTALVLGATGGIGRPVALRLAASGWTFRALHRDPARLEMRDPLEWIQGDALVPEDVARVARGASIIIHAVKPRAYRDWREFVLPMIDNTLAAAHGARVLVPGNVYNYGPDAGVLIREDVDGERPTAGRDGTADRRSRGRRQGQSHHPARW